MFTELAIIIKISIAVVVTVGVAAYFGHRVIEWMFPAEDMHEAYTHERNVLLRHRDRTSQR